ncbi:MAG: hypothetical protein QUS11_00605 [Candidatus Fermentibacter sp.]|nr:hypothetical protein [Candidatus Fermentibacter sp.]
MRSMSGIVTSLMIAALPASAADTDPGPVVEAFFSALRTGDSTAVDSLVSDEALSMVETMLDALKQTAEFDPDGVAARLASAGYAAGVGELEDWDSREYLKRTVALPVMAARYLQYEMTVGEPSYDGDRAVVPLVFATSGGFTLESEAILDLHDGAWMVTGFLGLNSFP